MPSEMVTPVAKCQLVWVVRVSRVERRTLALLERRQVIDRVVNCDPLFEAMRWTRELIGSIEIAMDTNNEESVSKLWHAKVG